MTPVSAFTATTPAQPAPRGHDLLEGTQDRFLQLLITQMRNQDPLNPLDNAEITSQMAQLSTVSGINKLADLMRGMSQAFGQAQSLQAASLIGRGVFTPGNAIVLSQGNALAAVDLPQAVEQLQVNIKNAAGQTVYSANLGAQNAGLVTLQWDGMTNQGTPAGDGRYTFEVLASAGGQPVTDATRMSFGRVNSVTFGESGAQLNVDGIGNVGLSQVKQIM